MKCRPNPTPGPPICHGALTALKPLLRSAQVNVLRTPLCVCSGLQLSFGHLQQLETATTVQWATRGSSHPVICCCDSLRAVWVLAGGAAVAGGKRAPLHTSGNTKQRPASYVMQASPQQHLLALLCLDSAASATDHLNLSLSPTIILFTDTEPAWWKNEAMVYLARLKGALLVLSLETKVPSKTNIKLNLGLCATTVVLSGCLTSHTLGTWDKPQPVELMLQTPLQNAAAVVFSRQFTAPVSSA